MIVELDGFVVSTDPEGPVNFKLRSLENWYSSPPVRIDVAPLPLSDGGFNPVRSYRLPKVMSIQGFCYGATADDAVRLAWEQIAALSPAGESMSLHVTDGASERMMTVWLNGNPQVLPFTHGSARFEVPLIAPDPRKYLLQGERETGASGNSDNGLVFPLFASNALDFGAFAPSGLFFLENNGTAESWPVFRVRGEMIGGFEIVSEGRVLRYGSTVPAGQEVFLSPYAGGRATIGTSDVTSNLTQVDWPSVPGGATQQFVFNALGTANANALLTTVFSNAWW